MPVKAPSPDEMISRGEAAGEIAPFWLLNFGIEIEKYLEKETITNIYILETRKCTAQVDM